jgi:hypothetical protein
MPRSKALTRDRGAAQGVRSQALSTASVARELTRLETDLGGRQSLLALLALAPLTPDLRYVLGLLGDPAHDHRSLASICADGNLLPGDLLKHLGAAALHRGQVLARQRIGDSIPAVVEDVMRRAAPYEEACGTCMVDGVATGRVTPDPTPADPNPLPQICPECKGSLKILYLPSLDRQRVAIDLAHLVERGGGISITNQNLNLGAAASGGQGALEQLQTLTDQILYGEAIEAEVLPEPAASTPVDPPEAS